MDDWKSWTFATGYDRVLRRNYNTDMCDHINPKEMLPLLPSLSQSDNEEVICEQDNHGARNAFHTLKACLLRKAKLQEFIEALRAVGLTGLADRMVNDLEIACGRPPNGHKTDRGQGDTSPMTLAETGQVHPTITLTNCNVQMGSDCRMSVSKSGDSLTDGDMSSLEASDTSLGAEVNETGSTGSRQQPPSSPDRRTRQLNISPNGRTSQIDVSPDQRSWQLDVNPHGRAGQLDMGSVGRSEELDISPDLRSGQPHVSPGGRSGQPYVSPNGRSGQPHVSPDGRSGQPHLSPDGRSGQTHVSPDGRSGQPHVSPDGRSGQPHVSPDGRLGQPHVSPDGRSGQPHVSPDGRSGQPHVSPDGRSGQPHVSPDLRSGQPHVSPDGRSGQADVSRGVGMRLPYASDDIGQGHATLRQEADVSLCASVTLSDLSDTKLKTHIDTTPEVSVEETMSAGESLPVEVPGIVGEGDVGAHGLSEEEGSSDEETQLLKPCRCGSVQTDGDVQLSSLMEDHPGCGLDDVQDRPYGRPDGSSLVSGQSGVSLVQDNTVQSDVSLVQDNTVQGDVTTVQGDVITVQSDVTTIQGDVTNVKSDVTNVQSDVTTVQGDVTTVQSDVTTVQSDVTTVQSDVTTVQSDVTNVQGNVDQSRGNSLVSFVVAAAVAIAAVIFLIRRA